MVPRHINDASDLVTSHSAIREGFLKQALAKTMKATPFVEEALLFMHALQEITEVAKLSELSQHRDQLIAAAGFSEKARNHLSEDELDKALIDVCKLIAEKSGKDFREEILFRYLLTKGDALGGQMRNWTGAEGQAGLQNTGTFTNHKGHLPKIVSYHSGDTIVI